MIAVPVERACAVCVHQNKLLLVHMRDPLTGAQYFFPPGGKLEDAESADAAAIRETWEETGYRVHVMTPLRSSTARYLFLWSGTHYDCTTHFIRVHLLDSERAVHPDAAYNLGPVWVPVADAAEAMAFHPIIRDHTVALMR